MNLISNKIFLEHETGLHPENKKRLEGLSIIYNKKIENGEKYLKLFHYSKYIEHVKRVCKFSGMLDIDTITSKNSYKAAVHAVGATIMASEKGDFALVRPPGHHAFPKKAGGFCIFNNISIAVENLTNKGKRVLIIDFDSHHGNGTSKFFYDRDDVLYFSIHQYPAFPGTGKVSEIGEKSGKGYNINIPLPPKSGDDIYLHSLKNFIPILKQFNPDIVAISAGFDGHKSDPLLQLNLSVNSYYKTGRIIRENFNKYFATLEGGYNTKILQNCIYSFLQGINNQQLKFHEELTRSNITVIKKYNKDINLLKENLTKYWKI